MATIKNAPFPSALFRAIWDIFQQKFLPEIYEDKAQKSNIKSFFS